MFLDSSGQGLERIKEVKENNCPSEKKNRRFTENLDTYSPPVNKTKEVILDKIDLEAKTKASKLKKAEAPKEEKKNEEDLENSKSSLQKSFRIRNQRSVSDIRENSEKVTRTTTNKKQEIIHQKLQLISNFTNNKHLIHNKMQKRPDTTGAKNRDKKYVIVGKQIQKNEEDKKTQEINSGNKISKIPDNVKEKFKEEFIEKIKNGHDETKISNFHMTDLEIKKEFSTDLFDEFKFGELLGEGFYFFFKKITI